MTVLTTTAFTGPYFPNGSTTAFPFDFRALATSEIMVVRRPTPPNHTGPDVVIGGYSVTLTPTGGTVTFSSPPLAGDPLYVLSNPSFEQQTNLASQGAFSPTTVNGAFDKAAIRDIYLKDLISRCVRSTDQIAPLPSAGGRLGTILAFNANSGVRELLTYDDLAVFLADAVTVIWRQITQSDRDLASTYAATAGTYLDAIRTALGTTAFAGTLTAQAASRAEIAALSGMSAGKQVFLSEIGKIGLWVWDPANRSAAVTSDPYQGLYIAPASASTGASGAWVRRVDDDFYLASWWAPPKDGTDAGQIFNSLSQLITSRGGGKLRLERGVVYSVGAQVLNGATPFGTYRFAPLTAYFLNFTDCTEPVEIDLNGAELRAISGLKYGAFNTDGTPIASASGYVGPGASTPYFAMINCERCTGGLTIKSGDLNGNIANLTIGGRHGDAAWQLPATGININDCSGPIRIEGINSHHHALDGLITSGLATSADDDDENCEILDSQFDSNGRQGWSHVQGKGYRARRCSFSWTGKAAPGSDANGPVPSTPGCGIDIENETGIIRDCYIEDCEIVGNKGPGIQTYGGDTQRVRILRTLLVGTTSFAAVLTQLDVELIDCCVVGAIANAWPSAEKALATKFRRTRFYASAARSPTGAVYFQSGLPVVFEFGGLGSLNILFEDYLIDTEDNTTALIGGAGNAIFRDGTQNQVGTASVNIDGHYEGRNVITTGGTVSLSTVFNTGDLIVNDVAYTTSFGGDIAVAKAVRGQSLNTNTVGLGLDSDAESLVTFKTDWAAGGYKKTAWVNAADQPLGDMGLSAGADTVFKVRVPNFGGTLTDFLTVGPTGVWTEGGGYYVQGVKVVGPQRPAITDPTGGTVADAEARTAITAINAALRNHGLIAT